jgi:hypothetical protein
MIEEKIHLGKIAYARSGDKGEHANIGVIAYTPEGYQYLCSHLTKERVQVYFADLGVREVLRYELPNLGALNFLLKGALDGGGSRTLRIDAQGKALGQALLEIELDIPEELLSHCRQPC